MEHPFHITFGIEFEFLLAYEEFELDSQVTQRVRKECARKEAGPDDVERMLQAEKLAFQRAKFVPSLRAIGISTNEYGVKRQYDKWTVEGDGSVKVPEDWGNITRFTWANGQETQFTEDERSRLRFVDVEITTRILDYELDSFMEIQTVLHHIVQNFPLILPPSAALHVHVGNQKAGFPLRTIVNLATLTSCFQRLFNEIHSEYRLFSQYVMLPEVAFSHKDRHPLDMANIINSCKTMKELLDLFLRYRTDPDADVIDGWRAYNFAQLLEGGSKTIEYRQHEGTLSFDRVARWVNLVVGLTCVSHTLDSSYIHRLVYEHATNPDSNLLVLLPLLHLSESAEDYKGLLHIHSPDLEFPDLRTAAESEEEAVAGSDTDFDSDMTEEE